MRTISTLSVFFVMTVVLLACSGPRQPAEIPSPPEAAAAGPTFGLILIGPKDDFGWSEAHYLGGQYVEEVVPDSQMLLQENLNPDAHPDLTMEEVVHDMVEAGASVIFTTSEDFVPDTLLAAEHHPDTYFVQVNGTSVLQNEAPPNLRNLMGKFIYAKAIAGCAAALATESGQIGYMGALIKDETRRLINPANLGARYCYENYRGRDPETMTFTVEWIGFWFHIPGVTEDPIVVANEMFDSGIDVLISGIDTTEPLVVAEERAAAGAVVWAMPRDYEAACEVAPEVCLGVPYFNWGPAYARIVSEVASGEWESEWEWVAPYWPDINDADQSVVGFKKGEGLTATQSEQLDQFIAGLGDGSIELFTGPLWFQDGTRYLEVGEVATEEQLWYVPQLLRGIRGLSQ